MKEIADRGVEELSENGNAKEKFGDWRETNATLDNNKDCPREGPVDSHYVKNSEKSNKCISGCSNTSEMNNNISLMSIISCVTPFSEKRFQKQT